MALLGASLVRTMFMSAQAAALVIGIHTPWAQPSVVHTDDVEAIARSLTLHRAWFGPEAANENHGDDTSSNGGATRARTLFTTVRAS